MRRRRLAGWHHLLHCHDEFSDRFPWMPQADEYERGGFYCIDLIVEANAGGVIELIDLESFSVAETLLLSGHIDASRAVAHFIGQDSAAVLEHLPGILDRLFRDGPRDLRDRGAEHVT